MELVGRTVLITGGSEGIGLELAKALAPRNVTIICGRSADKLARAKAALPNVVTKVCDITDAQERKHLLAGLLKEHPDLDVLVNNAGSRHRIDLRAGGDFDDALSSDLNVNYLAPACLATELLGHLRQQRQAAIVNVTTGLVYLPKAVQPFYCAAKAALHSYTRSLRWALRDSRVQVFEALMPLVDTNFHQGELAEAAKAMSAKEAARLTLDGILRDREEIHVGKAALARWVGLLAPRTGMALVNK